MVSVEYSINIVCKLTVFGAEDKKLTEKLKELLESSLSSSTDKDIIGFHAIFSMTNYLKQRGMISPQIVSALVPKIASS